MVDNQSNEAYNETGYNNYAPRPKTDFSCWLLDREDDHDDEEEDPAYDVRELVDAWKEGVQMLRERFLRYKLLYTQLWRLGCSLRSDSSLCRSYVSGFYDRCPAHIADEMAFMKFLHEFVPGYTTRVEAAVEMLATEALRGYVDDDDPEPYYYRGIRSEAVEYVKAQVPGPAAWPWPLPTASDVAPTDDDMLDAFLDLYFPRM